MSPVRYRRPRLGTVVLGLTIGLGVPTFVVLCVLVVALAGSTR